MMADKMNINNPSDLLLFDSQLLSKRCNVPINQVQEIQQHLSSLQAPNPFFGIKKQLQLTTLTPEIDDLFGGGLYTNHIYEVYGEAGTGKSSFCLSLCFSAQLPIEYGGLDGESLIISTSGRLSIRRLSQIFNKFKQDYNIDTDILDWLDQIHSIHIRDQETQSFLLKYHIPNFIRNNNIKLLIIDSVTSNFRGLEEGGSNDIFKRSELIYELGLGLSKLAYENNMTIVLVNEVVSNFKPSLYVSGLGQGSIQQCDTNNDENIPALGVPLSSIVNTRVKFEKFKERRRMQVVFSPYCAPNSLEFDITENGLYVEQA